jgi:hypothetical protein
VVHLLLLLCLRIKHQQLLQVDCLLVLQHLLPHKYLRTLTALEVTVVQVLFAELLLVVLGGLTIFLLALLVVAVLIPTQYRVAPLPLPSHLQYSMSI